MKLSSAVITGLLVSSASAFVTPSTSYSNNNAVTSGSSTTALNLKVGETAPDFALKDQNGKTVKRSSIKKPLVFYFYPADATPGCTKQATSFNDAVKEIRQQYGADVVGISGQDVASKQAFAKELGLDFSILADEGDAVRKAFAVPKAAFGLLPGRVTYVLDQKGVCQKVYDDLVDATAHVQVAKQALQALKPTAGARK